MTELHPRSLCERARPLVLPPLTALALLASLASGQDRPDARPDEGGEEQELPEVIIIGRTQAQGVPEVPLDSIGSRDVLGPERVKETGARDLNDLVQNLPAISTRPYNGGEAAAPSFSMRGLPDDGLTEYVHVLIDGVSASPMPYGWTALSFLPLTTERAYALDYIRGGHAVRYSPNTVGGILNFITHPVPDVPSLETRSTYGSFDYSSNLISVGGPYGDLGLLATYVDRRGEGYRQDGGFDQQDANVKLIHDRGAGDWLATSLSFMESEHAAPGGLTRSQFDVDRFGNARPENRFTGSRGVTDVVLHDDLDDGWLEWYGTVSVTHRNLRAQRPHFGAPTALLDWDDRSWFTQVGVRAERETEWFGGDHTLYGGLRYHREWIPSWQMRSEPYPGGAGPLTQDASFSLDSVAAHVDDTFEPTEDLTVTAGLRAEWIPDTSGEDDIVGWQFENDYFDVLPGIGASYALGERWALFANYFEGFRAPQVWGYAYTTGDALVFEEGTSLEAGARFEAEAGLKGSATMWRTEYDDFGVFYTGFYENLGRIVADGLDFVLEWYAGEVSEPLEGLVLSASLTAQDSELRSGPNAGNETPYAWQEKAAWRARYETAGGWSASLGGTFVGDSFSDDANTATENADGNLGLNPARTLWDARLAKHVALGDVGQLELAVGATNLFDQDWYVHSRGGFFGGGLVAGPPRQEYFMVQLSMSW